MARQGASATEASEDTGRAIDRHRRSRKGKYKMTEAEEKYKDIINLSWDSDPVFFIRHPRMSLQERAKIFSPFAPLRGHSDRLQEEADKIENSMAFSLKSLYNSN